MLKNIKILVVDDSAVYRKILSNILETFSIVENVDTASDGLEAIDKLNQKEYDLITLDVLMPKMNGIDTLREIQKLRPETPTIMISSYTTHSAIYTIKAMKIGAVDFITKPDDNKVKSTEKFLHRELQNKIIGALYRKIDNKYLYDYEETYTVTEDHVQVEDAVNNEIISIGASTAGISALQYIIKNINAKTTKPIVIVQHMPEYFEGPLLDELKQNSKLDIQIPENTSELKPSTIYIAPGDAHLKVSKTGTILTCTIDPLSNMVSGFKPSIDVLFYSVALAAGKNSTAIILSGTGTDGVKGLKAIQKAGGKTIAQSPDSSRVPGIIIESMREKAINHIVPLKDIPKIIDSNAS